MLCLFDMVYLEIIDMNGKYCFHLTCIFGHFDHYKHCLFYHQIPKDEETLTKWLYDRYEEKEAILQEYYDTGIFPDAHTTHDPKFEPVETNRLTGQRVVHDTLEFILRHIFYIVSTWIWMSFLYWVFTSICQLVWWFGSGGQNIPCAVQENV